MLEEVWNRKVQKAETHDDKVMFEFVDFAKSLDVNSSDIHQAYLELCDVADEKSSDPKVTALLERMSFMMKGGFPINRFAELVKTKEEYEALELQAKKVEHEALQSYADFIETLPLTEKEKRVLNSIVTQLRNGELAFKIDGSDVVRVNIVIKTDDKGKCGEDLLKIYKEKVIPIVSKHTGKMTIEFSEND